LQGDRRGRSGTLSVSSLGIWAGVSAAVVMSFDVVIRQLEAVCSVSQAISATHR